MRKHRLTNSLCDAIKKKNKLLYNSTEVRCMPVRTKNKYGVYCSHLGKLRRAAEKKNYCDFFPNIKSDSETLWDVVKNVIDKKTKYK